MSDNINNLTEEFPVNNNENKIKEEKTNKDKIH